MNNITLRKSIILSFVALLFLTLNASAGASGLEGLVKDSAGRPVKSADVRIEAKNFSKIVKTDARGHYICDGLAIGTYRVTLVANGQVKASITDAKTQSGKATQLNFNLTGQTVPAKKKTHMVYIRPDVDTHIGGGGRWVEVDENGNIVGGNTGAGSNVQTVTGTAAQDTVIRMKVQNPGR
jgi:hypothetical protein